METVSSRFGPAATAGLIVLILAIVAATELAMGRPPICTCGHVALWHGAIDSGNSQHLLDWYSPSHVIHGFLFCGLTWLLLRRLPARIRLMIAVIVEAGWELLENSPIVIDRYRTATMALGYTGDSVLNSLSDIGCMMIGFALRAPAAGLGNGRAGDRLRAADARGDPRQPDAQHTDAALAGRGDPPLAGGLRY